MDPKSPRNSKSADQVTDDVRALSARVARGEIGTARAWGGADVCIVRRPRKPSESSWGSEPKYVVTKYVAELSWLFEELRDIFYQLGGDIAGWKYDFFGSLADAAEFAIQMGKDASPEELLLAVCDVAATLPTRYA